MTCFSPATRLPTTNIIINPFPQSHHITSTQPTADSPAKVWGDDMTTLHKCGEVDFGKLELPCAFKFVTLFSSCGK